MILCATHSLTADFWREHELINMCVGKIVLTCLLGKSRSVHLLWGCQVETRSSSGKKKKEKRSSPAMLYESRREAG